MSIEYRKSVDIKHSVDVVVAGGGPAGVSAAFSAAMCGKNVLIIDAFYGEICSLEGKVVEEIFTC